MENEICCGSLLDPGNATLAKMGEIEGAQFLRRLVIIDKTVMTMYRDQLISYFAAWHLVPIWKVIDDEKFETRKTVLEIAHAMTQAESPCQNEPVIAIGGNSLLDQVGFAAKKYHQNLPYIRVPMK